MRVNTNVPALISFKSLAVAQNHLADSVKRLASGLRVQSAKDDAAGLAISEKMTAVIRGTDQAVRNAQDGQSMLRVAEGGLGEIHAIIQRMRELSAQSANDTLTAEDRAYIQLEIDELTAQINDIANNTQFNKKKILNGDSAVLWSTSTRDIAVIVSGNLISKDIFGEKISAAGNYKLTFNTIQTGSESVQKSNVMYLKHGTHESALSIDELADLGELSGLGNLRALNMVEAEWRLETRETPFGGVKFYEYLTGNMELDEVQAADIGIAQFDASATPNIVAAGEYDIRISDVVPMMADFKNALDLGVVTGVEMSSRTAASDFDAVFDIKADVDTVATGTQYSETQVYRGDDILGGVTIDNADPSASVNIETSDTYASNVFTHFAVTATDARDVMMGDITVTESYVAASNASIAVTLDYMSAAGQSVDFVTTYHADAGAKIMLQQNTTFSVSITNGTPMNDIADAITAASNGTITVAYNNVSKTLQLTNPTTSGSTSVSYSLSENTSGIITGLGLSSLPADLATSFVGSPVSQASDIYAGSGGTLTFTGTSNLEVTVGGQNIEDAATTLSNTTNGGVWQNVNFGTVASSGQTQLTGTNTSGRVVEITASGAEWFTASVNLANGVSASPIGTARDHNTQHTITDLGGITMDDVGSTDGIITTINNAIGSYGVSVSKTLPLNAAAQTLTFSKTTAKYDFRIVADATSSSIESELGMNSISLAYNATVGQATTNNVYNGHLLSVNVYDSDMSEISTYLNNAIKTALNSDGITGNNNQNLVNFTSSTGTGQITLNNNADSAYKITIANGTGTAASETGIAGTASRGGSITGASLDHLKETIINVAGKNIEETRTAIRTAGSAVTFWAEWTDPANPPSYDGSHHDGQITLTNNTGDVSLNGDARRKYTITQANTVSQAEAVSLFTGNPEIWASSNSSSKQKSADSNTIQARDRLWLTITWDGNRASDAGRISGSVGNIVLWEGDDDAVNAGRVNTATGLSNLFTSFDIKDTDKTGTDGDNASDLKVGDSWMLYTKARVAGTADNINLELYDGKYSSGKNNGGVTGDATDIDIVYSFVNGALDGKAVQLGELVRIADVADKNTGAEHLVHNLEFGTVSADTTVKYGERQGAGSYWNNTAGVNSWYSHAYYGPDTTYYFKNGRDPDGIVREIIVNRQNTMNASMLFMYEGGSTFTVLTKGFDRGGNILNETRDTLTVSQILANGIQGIQFTTFDVALASLSAGDKFVVNVAAAAMLDGENTDPSLAVDFQSTANIAVDGDPWRRGDDFSEIWGSAAQYRLANGAEDGADLKLLGYFVDPINGNLSVPGVGYYDGQFEMKVGDDGFETGSTVGAPGVDDVGARYIHAEVNYQGSTLPLAGALVTSVYFSEMESGHYSAVKDFIGAVGYSNFNYGIRSDGTYGPLSETGSESYNSLNASLIFDAVKVTDNVITFRVQAHVIDLFGNEWYAEDEEVHLNGMANTSRDSTAVPPIIPNEVNDPVVLFRDAAFGGLYFDEFTLRNTSVWAEGDRFTLALTASGEEDPAIDEITLFSDQRGTTMPIGYRFYDGVLDNSTVDLGIYQLANNIAKPDSDHFAKDQVMDGVLSLSFGEFHPPVADYPTGVNVVRNAARFQSTFQRGMDAGVAHYYSRLEDIKQFWDSNGVFILENNDQQLTIRQKDREIKIMIGAGEELGKLAEYMSERIWTDLLMQYDGVPRGKDDEDSVDYNPYLMREEDKHEIIRLVNNVPGNNPNATVVGTLLAHSVIPSKESALKFYGSEALMKAFSFVEIKEARDTVFRVNVSDAHSGETVKSGVTLRAGERAYKIIADGIELDIDGDIGLVASDYDAARGVFEATIEKQFSQYIHLADNAATLQIGASQGEDMTLTLGAVTAKALGIDNIDVRGRETAARSVTRLDNALGRVSRQRAIVGAQINRLDHAISGLSIASQNLTESRSRIVDADMAKEMVEFTKLNIMSQVGNSMLAQANALPRNILRILR